MESNPRRLNPFAFPPETNQRFGLFAAAAFMMAVNMAGFLVSLLPVSATGSLTDESLGSFAEQFAFTRDAAFAAFQSIVGIACILLAMVGVVSAVAIAIYRSHPQRIRRRQGLRTASEKDAVLRDGVAALAQEVGLLPVPSLEIQPGSAQADGQAFGLRRQPIIRLGGRMGLLMRRAPAMFRAIVLHEMAHIANGDIGRTYLTQAITTSVLLLAVSPLAIYAVGRTTLGFLRRVFFTVTGQPTDWLFFLRDALPSVGVIVFQTVFALLMVLALRASILRVREVYADWQAAVWGGEEGLITILTQAQKNEPPTRRPGWLRLHPTAGERLAFLREPDHLFRVTWELPAYAGLLAGITITGMIPLLFRLFSASVAGSTGMTALLGVLGIAVNSTLIARLGIVFAVVTMLITVLLFILPVLVITVQIAGSLGIQVAREAVADLVAQQRRGLIGGLPLLRSSALFSIGMQTGFVIVPFSFLAPVTQMLATGTSPGLWVRAAAETIGWVIVMTGLMWLTLAYLRVLTGQILGDHVGKHAPNGKCRGITAIMTLLLWTILLAGLAWQYNIYRMIWPQIPLGVLGGATAGILVAGGLIAGIGAAWVAARVMMGRPRCPVCNTPTRSRKVLGKGCHHCGSDLAPWLFAW